MIRKAVISLIHEGQYYIFLYIILISSNVHVNQGAYVIHLPLINLTCLDNRDLYCKNNGICVSRRNNEFLCSCPTPYCGNTCAGIRPNCNISLKNVSNLISSVGLLNISPTKVPRSLDCNNKHLACRNNGKCVHWKPSNRYICSCRQGFCGSECSMSSCENPPKMSDVSSDDDFRMRLVLDRLAEFYGGSLISNFN